MYSNMEQLEKMNKEELINEILYLQEMMNEQEITISELKDSIENIRQTYKEELEDNSIDYSSLIYQLDIDNYLSEDLKEELEYIKRYKNNYEWLSEIEV